jgi:Family of unknown function (DUF6325)
MDLGPVELVVLVFPGVRAEPAVVAAVSDVVSRGYVTILDLIVLSRDADGDVTLIDFDENLEPAGLAGMKVNGQALVSDDDMDLVRDLLDPASTAVVIVYEETWARHVADAVRTAGGEVALHVQLPRDTVVSAVAAAAES